MRFLFSSKKAYTTIRMIIGLIFVGSGLIKLTDLSAFSDVINAFALIPRETAYSAGMLIATVEVIAGTGLIGDVKGSLGVVAALLLVFMAVLGHAMAMGYDIDCGCFGARDPEKRIFSNLKGAFVRDSLLMALILYLYGWRFKNGYSPKALRRVFLLYREQT